MRYLFIKEDEVDSHKFTVFIDVTGIPEADEARDDEIRSLAKLESLAAEEDILHDWMKPALVERSSGRKMNSLMYLI